MKSGFREYSMVVNTTKKNRIYSMFILIFLKYDFAYFFQEFLIDFNPHNSRSLDYDINLKFAYKPFLRVDRALHCKSEHTSRQKLGYI